MAVGGLLLVPTIRAAEPRHVVERAALRPVEADLSYFKGSDQFGEPTYGRLRVGIFLSGKPSFTELFPSKFYSPAGSIDSPRSRSIHVLRLQPGYVPEVLVDLYTGGAHCCFLSIVYSYNSTLRRWRRVKHDWGNAFYRLRKIGSDLPVLVSSDNRFAYAFSSFGGSALPVQVWQMRNGLLRDVTQNYPALLRKDAAHWWRLYLAGRKQPQPDLRGILAGYAADEALLGQWQHAKTVLQAARLRGELDFSIYPTSAAQYLRQLQRRLTRWGYL
jgi:hypothetical protein